MSHNSFNALIIDKKDNGTRFSASITEFTSADSLPNQSDGLLIRVTHSSLNYKDGLAITGKGRILRKYPMVPGIDLAGIVEEADSIGTYHTGQPVLVTGFGLGEQVSGGYSGFARVKPDWVIPVPKGLSSQQCMSIGTAGLTSMLSLLALENHGVLREQGPILVTGAAGGVGSIAILILSKRGYKVTGSSGRIEEHGKYLENIGASELINREELSKPSGKPLDSERWAGAIDSVGGQTLASILRQTRYGGSVAACGLAGGVSLSTTVLPFILRGVNLLGIDSVMCPRVLREHAWNRLSEDLELEKLDSLTQVISLKEIPNAAEDILSGKVLGRIVVDLNL